MKKLFAFFLAVFMIASMSVTVFAEANVGEHGESATIVVGGDFQPTGAIYKTISVDIEWDDMTFAYVKTSSGEWDPGSHEYVGGVEGAWSEETRTITVTNHSDTELTATLSFEQLVDITGVFTSTGEMSSLLELDSAVGTSRDEAPSASEEFGIIGGEPLEENTSIGMITVYIDAPEGTVTEGPMITSATLSGDEDRVEDLGSGNYKVVCTEEVPFNDVEVTLSGANIDMIEGQENYRIGFLTSDGEVHNSMSLKDFTYNEAEDCLTGNITLDFCDEDLIPAYSEDEGATWTRLPQRVIYYMTVTVSDVILSGSKVTFDESTNTYTIRHNAAKLNTEFDISVFGSGIKYMTGPSYVTVAFLKSDGTVVDSVKLTRHNYYDAFVAKYLETTLSDPHVVEGETLTLAYDLNGEWVDTGKKVVYDVYYSISDYS